MCTPVIAADDCLEAVLAGGVPLFIIIEISYYLQLDAFSGNIEILEFLFFDRR
jgi:hypothetical protein